MVGRWMNAAGMETSVDAAGNLRGVRHGDSPRRLYIGSHLDSVPDGGAFDGVLGVAAGVALVEQLERERLPFSIEVVAFSDEEGCRFGVPFIGSRAFAASLEPATLSVCDARGIRLSDAMEAFGVEKARLSEAVAAPDAIGWIELHVEQGRHLDTLGIPIGVVDLIVGQTRIEASFIGTPGHAGTTPMLGRHDAVTAMAEWVLAVERHARSVTQMVATVGRIAAVPGTTNVIAERCEASLDVRHPDDRVRAASVHTLLTTAEKLASERGVRFQARYAPQPARGRDGRTADGDPHAGGGAMRLFHVPAVEWGRTRLDDRRITNAGGDAVRAKPWWDESSSGRGRRRCGCRCIAGHPPASRRDRCQPRLTSSSAVASSSPGQVLNTAICGSPADRSPRSVQICPVALTRSTPAVCTCFRE